MEYSPAVNDGIGVGRWGWSQYLLSLNEFSSIDLIKLFLFSVSVLYPLKTPKTL